MTRRLIKITPEGISGVQDHDALSVRASQQVKQTVERELGESAVQEVDLAIFVEKERMNQKPVRVQRKRTRGFKLQEAVKNGMPVFYVGRPTKWGNPYQKTDPQSLDKFRQHIEQKMLADKNFLVPLHGKNLACFCPLDSPCHADILLELVNAKKTK